MLFESAFFLLLRKYSAVDSAQVGGVSWSRVYMGRIGALATDKRLNEWCVASMSGIPSGEGFPKE